ncbi:MAG: polyamine ABC transporter substrate-binding protein [Ferrovibrio sp.]|uniref:polyamine ABC transporter substrate-binding protein n=1 Tax=Ferrovibrio sp. TaxID=1917215 RepID=UPI0026206A77|nr:polyamine ABC transporter substrate-binding protein [Ferrovibrio sp.]MCW0232635.1 polyamine ABC transporter substrate-binding protein [Ferrovibrio sp.]
MYLTRLPMLAALLAALSFGTPFTGAVAQEKAVNVYNWSDYVDPQVLKDFEVETGIRVRYDVYDSNDTLEAKLLAGKSGYDVVVPTQYYMARQVQAKLLRPLDRTKIPNFARLDPAQMERLAKYDPGNQHAAIYLWGTSGIGLNPDKIKQRMANPPAYSLKMLFDPEIVSKFADCGVVLLDAPDEIMVAALKYLGLDPNAKDAASIAKAEAVLMKVRPYIRKFHSSQYINDLANGDACLAYGFSGDILQARTRAEEAKKGVRVQYLLPREGAQQWFDVMAIPADAPNPDNAHAFINYILQPKVIAKITNAVQYPNAVPESLSLVSKDAMADKDVFPPVEALKNLYTVVPSNQAEQRLLTRAWTRVKGGN